MKQLLAVVKTSINHPKYCFFVIGLLSLFFLALVPELKLDIHSFAMFKQDDPELVYVKIFIEQYGSDDALLIFMSDDNLFDPQILSMIDRITKKLEAFEEIERVISLSNVTDIRGEEDQIMVGPLIESPEDFDTEQAELIRKRVLANPIYFKSSIVSKVPI